MSFSPRGLIACIAGTLLLLMPTAPVASAAGAGGVEADTGSVSSPPAGGAEFDSASLRPGVRVRAVRLPRSRVTRGSAPRLAVRIVRPGARTVRVEALITGPGGRRRVAFRRVATGRTVRLTLPRTRRLGRHGVRLVVRGLQGDQPARTRSVSFTVVRRPKPRPTPKPARPAPQPAPAPAPVPEILGGEGLVSGVFPVRGAYTLGGAASRFGADRTGHTHEGQDIVAASGTPVVAPLAGTVIFNDHQPQGAGRYVVLRADNGWDMFFAHCLAGSAPLAPGSRVGAGGQLCLVGSTGGSSGPHLHFEIWPGGWRHLKGTRPIDPLPQLRRWAAG